MYIKEELQLLSQNTVCHLVIKRNEFKILKTDRRPFRTCAEAHFNSIVIIGQHW